MTDNDAAPNARQAAYRALVSADLAALERDDGDMRDPGAAGIGSGRHTVMRNLV